MKYYYTTSLALSQSLYGIYYKEIAISIRFPASLLMLRKLGFFYFCRAAVPLNRKKFNVDKIKEQ